VKINDLLLYFFSLVYIINNKLSQCQILVNQGNMISQ